MRETGKKGKERKPRLQNREINIKLKTSEQENFFGSITDLSTRSERSKAKNTTWPYCSCKDIDFYLLLDYSYIYVIIIYNLYASFSWDTDCCLSWAFSIVCFHFLIVFAYLRSGFDIRVRISGWKSIHVKILVGNFVIVLRILTRMSVNCWRQEAYLLMTEFWFLAVFVKFRVLRDFMKCSC